jgi:hypothetical protein
VNDVGFRTELDAEVEAAIAEGLGDHFYGAWRGDGKGSGGRPAGGHPGGKVGQGVADAQAAAKAGPGLMDRTARSSLKAQPKVGFTNRASLPSDIKHATPDKLFEKAIGSSADPSRAHALTEMLGRSQNGVQMLRDGVPLRLLDQRALESFQTHGNVADRKVAAAELARRSRLREAGGDHFYGAWKGGSAKAGGSPSGGADGNPRTSKAEEAVPPKVGSTVTYTGPRSVRSGGRDYDVNPGTKATVDRLTGQSGIEITFPPKSVYGMVKERGQYRHGLYPYSVSVLIPRTEVSAD